MARLALLAALLGLLARSCSAQEEECTDSFSRCCRQLGTPTRFKGPIEDPDGKRIGSLTFCFTGTEDDPTSGYTRTRVNARGRRITDGLTVEIGYVGAPPDSELTLAQSDNFTEVGIPTAAAAPGQTAPRRTIRRVPAKANRRRLSKAGCNRALNGRVTSRGKKGRPRPLGRRGRRGGCK